jgi:hypothetical protein
MNVDIQHLSASSAECGKLVLLQFVDIEQLIRALSISTAKHQQQACGLLGRGRWLHKLS